MGLVSKETIVLGKLGGNDLVTESMIKLLFFLEPVFGIGRVCFLSLVSIEIVLQNPAQITRKYLFQVKPNFVWAQWEMLSIIIIIIVVVIIFFLICRGGQSQMSDGKISEGIISG